MTNLSDEKDYKDYADQPMDKQHMESLAAETDEGVDVDQAVLHHIYIGWVLGLARGKGLTVYHLGGNQIEIDQLPDVPLVIPMPPSGWKP